MEPDPNALHFAHPILLLHCTFFVFFSLRCVSGLGRGCKVFVQPIFSLFSVQNPDICTPTENHDPSTVLDQEFL